MCYFHLYIPMYSKNSKKYIWYVGVTPSIGIYCDFDQFRRVSTCSDVFRHVLIQFDRLPLQSTGRAINFDISIEKIEPETAE